MVEKGHAALVQKPVSVPTNDEIRFVILRTAYSINFKKILLDFMMSREEYVRLGEQTLLMEAEIKRLRNKYDNTVRP